MVPRRLLPPPASQAPVLQGTSQPRCLLFSGGAGYIGSRIVARLLAAGHTVYATRRAAGDDEAAIAALQELPGAQERLRWLEADLMQAGSFDAAVAGCK